MPFLVADESAVTVEEPVVICNQVEHSPSELLDGWDYRQPLQIAVAFKVEEGMFRSQTGLVEVDDLAGVVVAIQVDCPATNWRALEKMPLASALHAPGAAIVDIPAGTVAQQLTISCSVLLDREDGQARTSRAAHLRGSRLFTNDITWRVALEGDGAGFPTDAFNFAANGMPAQAPWHLFIARGANLDMLFMKAVRLQINTEHPAAEALLPGRNKHLNSLLFHDILLQMLLAVAPEVRRGAIGDWEEDSLGEVLENLCQTYMFRSLPAAVADLTSDSAEFLTSLKNSTQFLEGYQP